MYYRWSKAFPDAGKNCLTRDTQRDATTDEVRALKNENAALKKALAESVHETTWPALCASLASGIPLPWLSRMRRSNLIYIPYEALFSHSGRFNEKREPGAKPDSL